MIKRTPKATQSVRENPQFSPISLATSPKSVSPQKNLTGPPRVARDIVADLYNNIQKWNSLHIIGCGLIKQIANLKADEPKTYSYQLECYINDLYMTVESLKTNVDLFGVLIAQIEAFAKLPKIPNPVFFSLDALNIAQLVKDISQAYIKEFKIKQFVLENIAYGKNKMEVMFLATSWTHQVNVIDSINFKLESLLVETGHRPIT